MKELISSLSKERRLGDLSDAVQHCSLCPRLRSRTKVLSEANGSVRSRVLFVAEAPGRLGADRTGIPLFGDQSGDNFGALLGNIGWRREDVFVTNAVLCNPRDDEGRNERPSAEEIRNCRCYLQMAIQLVDPEVVVPLGTVALDALSAIAPHYANLASDVGRLTNWYGRKMMPLYHPGPRALIHRSLAKQTSDFIGLAKVVDPIRGLKDSTARDRTMAGARTLAATVGPLHQAIHAIVQSLGEVSYFKLTKLLYLIDLNALEKLGRTLTGELYLRQREGPWPPKLPEAVSSLDGYEVRRFFRGQLPYVSPGPAPRFDFTMDEDALAVVSDVLCRYGQMDNASIKIATYRTAPMQHVLREERKGRDMRRMPIIYKDKTILDDQP